MSGHIPPLAFYTTVSRSYIYIYIFHFLSRTSSVAYYYFSVALTAIICRRNVIRPLTLSYTVFILLEMIIFVVHYFFFLTIYHIIYCPIFL